MNKYRLSSKAYDREEEKDKIDVRKFFFLAVEGNVTEVEYFNSISKYRKELGIDYRIDVKPLQIQHLLMLLNC